MTIVAAGCGSNHRNDNFGDANGPADACVGLQCRTVNCAAMNMPPTTISGTVYAPNATLALYGFNVYIPSEEIPVTDDDVLTCGHCDNTLPGAPLQATSSDQAGKFTLSNVPSGGDIPLVISSGKWRRQVLIPTVMPCTDNPLPADITRLPKDRSEGNMPRIAVATGGFDSMECMMRRLGIADKEITTDHESGRVHLFAGATGPTSFRSGFMGGHGAFASSTTLWNSLDKLKNYDIVMLSCEGSPYPENKPQSAMDNMKMYADLGGRVFGSHYHGIWVKGAADTGMGAQAPAIWPSIAMWEPTESSNTPSIDIIDEVNNPKGPQFAQWMLAVGGSVTQDLITLTSGTGRATVISVDPTKGQQWVTASGTNKTQVFQFDTPNEVPEEQRCGKVVYSDMHVSGDNAGGTFPDNCGSTNTLSAQEKALAFMFFDIASCVGPIE